MIRSARADSDLRQTMSAVPRRNGHVAAHRKSVAVTAAASLVASTLIAAPFAATENGKITAMDTVKDAKIEPSSITTEEDAASAGSGAVAPQVGADFSDETKTVIAEEITEALSAPDVAKKVTATPSGKATVTVTTKDGITADVVVDTSSERPVIAVVIVKGDGNDAEDANVDDGGSAASIEPNAATQSVEQSFEEKMATELPGVSDDAIRSAAGLDGDASIDDFKSTNLVESASGVSVAVPASMKESDAANSEADEDTRRWISDDGADIMSVSTVALDDALRDKTGYDDVTFLAKSWSDMSVEVAQSASLDIKENPADQQYTGYDKGLGCWVNFARLVTTSDKRTVTSMHAIIVNAEGKQVTTVAYRHDEATKADNDGKTVENGAMSFDDFKKLIMGSAKSDANAEDDGTKGTGAADTGTETANAEDANAEGR